MNATSVPTTYLYNISTYTPTTTNYTTPNVTTPTHDAYPNLTTYTSTNFTYTTPGIYTTTDAFVNLTTAPFNITPTGNFTTNNKTFPPFPPFDEGAVITSDKIIAAVFYSILVVLIVCGNSLVIGSFRINRRLRTTTNFFIMSLAVADLSIGTISIPLWVYFSMIPSRLLGTVYKQEYSFWFAFDLLCGVSSILNLTMISLERCYALMRPIQHRNISKRVVVACILTAWVLAAFAGSLRSILPKEQLGRFGVIVAVPFFILPVTIIFGTYGMIFKIARAHARGRGVRSFRKDIRIATTVAVVIGLFTLCWLPFFSLNFFFSICSDFGVLVCRSVPQEVYPLAKWMQYGNSACNPVIYGFRNRDFRLAFKKIIYGFCGRDVQMSNAYNRSTMATTTRRRFVRSESSFDETQSVYLYPDQIVPPGMYDMRESYRKAVQSGAKTPIKPKAPTKGIAQGILSINMDALNMPVNGCNGSATKTDLVDSNENRGGTANVSAEEKDADSNVIEIYPLETHQQTNGVVNESFLHEKGASPSEQRASRVRFDKSEDIEQGIVNKGCLETDDIAESPPGGEDTLLVDLERERCHSDVTPVLVQSDLLDSTPRERGSSIA